MAENIQDAVLVDEDGLRYYHSLVERVVINQTNTNINTIKSDLEAKITNNVNTINGKIEELKNGKQDKLTGTASQYVGFDAEGNAKAINLPTHITMTQVNSAIDKAIGQAMNASY